MPSLLTTHDLLSSLPEPHSLIRVTNLSTTLPLATDAWGRPSKPQPILITCSISLTHPFSSASSQDSVVSAGNDKRGTVHYGVLSKAILEGCREFEVVCGWGDREEEEENGEKKRVRGKLRVPMCGKALVNWLCWWLTGGDVMPKISQYEGGEKEKSEERKPLLQGVEIEFLEIEVKMPKASLLGDGVSLRGTFVFGGEVEGGVKAFSMCLGLRRLRVPCLVGVNPNERCGRQVVVCGVEMERWDRMVDCYCELEELVVKSIEESSFQTLEAMATHIYTRILTYFLIPHSSSFSPSSAPSTNLNPNYQRIRIKLEKPTAVMFADAPMVEMVLDTDPSKSQLAAKLWKLKGIVRKPPFPLKGSFEEWVKAETRGRV